MFQILNTILLIISLVLTSSVMLLRYKHVLVLRNSRFFVYLQKPVISLLLLTSLFVFRYCCAIKKIYFYVLIFFSAVISSIFWYTRMSILAASNQEFSVYFILWFFVLVVLASLFSFFRTFFRTGFLLNQLVVNNPEILFILEHVAKQASSIFTNLGKHMVGNMSPSPINGGVDRHFALGLGTFGATAFAAGAGGYLGYEAYQSRQVAISNLAVATSNLAVTERGVDMSAVKDGFMSLENFNKKWDDLGNRR